MDKTGMISDAAEIAQEAGAAAAGGVKKMGQAALSQLGTGQPNLPSADQLAEQNKKDKEFSRAAEAQVKAKIRAIYEEYRMKRLREKRQEEISEDQKEQVQKQQGEMVRQQKVAAPVNPAIAKTRAEVGKNYGGE